MPGRMDDKIRCSFCGKTQDQVRKLIAGSNNVFICDECIDLARRSWRRSWTARSRSAKSSVRLTC